jgi:DNA invertase Pin-like site-specific DNA recombinase
MTTGRFVAYYRVSTKRQGRSGLGLDAQREAVTGYLNGGRWQLVADFTEIETGKNNNRPELARALAACRVHRATLVVAKLDRLSRNAAFLMALRDSGVQFVAVDMPEAGALTVGIMALVAQQEREAISQRTRAALAAARRRGVQLGTPGNLTDRGRRRGTRASIAVRQTLAVERARDLSPVVDELRAEGLHSLRELAAGLNARGITTPRGGEWSAVQVSRLLAQAHGTAAPR